MLYTYKHNNVTCKTSTIVDLVHCYLGCMYICIYTHICSVVTVSLACMCAWIQNNCLRWLGLEVKCDHQLLKGDSWLMDFYKDVVQCVATCMCILYVRA